MNITWLVKPGILSVATLIDRMSCAPAKIFGLEGGTLKRGSLGDVTVFDPKREWKVDPAGFRTKGRNTPYAGTALTGRAVATVVGGRVVFREK